MPPKVKITKEDIVKTAIELVREQGENAINARTVASALNCSTQPIFSNFVTMDELRGAVVAESYLRYLGFLNDEVERGLYPPYKAFGMAYIKFACEEKELFKLLFMCDRRGENISFSTDFNASVEMIMEANKVSKEKAQLMHLEMWTCVHGIATMMATSFLSLEWDLISGILSDVYHGIRSRQLEEEE